MLANRQLLAPSLSLRTDDGNYHHASPIAPSEITPPVTPIKGGNDGPNNDTRTGPREPLEFHGKLEALVDSFGRPVEFGRGVWSVVYMASSTGAANLSINTPPSSPRTSPEVFAVKSPLRRDADQVLRAEALILTHLSLVHGHGDFVIPFHGYVPHSHSIVMDAVPLSLSSYIEDVAGIARRQFSTRTMFNPVQGMESWQEMARMLIDALLWLHSKPKVVHGDIKPQNLLLRPSGASNRFPYHPLLADFSSAHEYTAASRTVEGTAASLSALTPPFTAPELLYVAALKAPDFVPTPESDVFSLAVTLLAAATGDLLLYSGSNSMQRLAMAREGHRVVDFTRSGPNGSRVPRNGTVEQVVKPAIAKDPAMRITPEEWLRVINTLR